ncbi:MAG: DNA repair protein RecN [Actinomycetota bacterium]|nr:DNA repair protein RecN [Actinomycetota bacterium]
MLAELNIANYAVIEELRLVLGRGFNVLTGETGAGKSIIIGALGFVLGDRADAGVVRAGADRAIVEAIFELDESISAHLRPLLPETTGGDELTLILAREVAPNGRSVCRINGRAVTLRQLTEVGMRLVDVHGQGAHLSLLRLPEQLELIDRYAGVSPLLDELAAVVRSLWEVRKALDGTRADEAAISDRLELLAFQVREIESARLEPGEDEALTKERSLLVNAERAAELLAAALEALDPDGSHISRGAADLVSEGVSALEALEKLDERFSELRLMAESIAFQLQDLQRELIGFRDTIEFDPHRLGEVQERLDAISALKRKYGPSIDAILEYRAQAAEELEALRSPEMSVAELVAREAPLLRQAARLAGQLSERRRAATADLIGQVEQELQGLGMAGARMGAAFEFQEDADGLPLGAQGFEVGALMIESGAERPSGEVSTKPLRFDARGVDRVELLVSANSGEPLRPLAKVASGGETARLMLAIKTVLSRADPVPTLVFDEIDAGIGGRIGETVGQRLWSLGRRHQVIAVTHLPQIACYADTHLQVSKVSRGGRTITRVAELTGDRRVGELSHMLGSDTAATRRKAEELLAGAESSRREGPEP